MATTKIGGDQILDEAITLAKLAPAISIPTSNLVDGGDFNRKSTLNGKGQMYVATAGSTIVGLVAPLTNDYVLVADSAQAAGMKWAAAPIPSYMPRWTKVSVLSSAFAGHNTNSYTVELSPSFVLPINGIIEGIVAQPSVWFTGTGLTSFTIELGVDASPALFVPAFSVWNAVPGAGSKDNFVTASQLSATQLGASLSGIGTTTMKATAFSTGAFVSAASSGSGSLDVWIKWSVLPS